MLQLPVLGQAVTRKQCRAETLAVEASAETAVGFSQDWLQDHIARR